MIKEPIYKLIHKNLDKQVNKSLMFITENYDDNSIGYILSNAGFSLNDNIILRYYESYGFICQDVNELTHGKSPLCQNIERFLNKNI